MNKELEEILQRLAEILPERPTAPDWSASIAFRWRSASRRGGAGHLQPVRQVHRIRLSDLRGIEKQIERVEQNTRQFLAGLPANNVLL
ncbi:MAG: DUF815 domain-containing protein, partial [Burkholderiales bacterium]